MNSLELFSILQQLFCSATANLLYSQGGDENHKRPVLADDDDARVEIAWPTTTYSNERTELRLCHLQLSFGVIIETEFLYDCSAFGLPSKQQ